MGINEDAPNLTAKVGSVDECLCCGVSLGVDAQVWQIVA